MKYSPLAMLVLFGGCTATQDEPAPPVGLANPASVHCVEKGGRLEIRKEAGGDVGYCHLPDGRVIEEWTLFRADRQQN